MWPTAAQVQLKGQIGQNVTFNCPHNEKKIKLFYLQKDQTLVNGFHAEKPLQTPTWENTEVVNFTTVHMYRLNISHQGTYRCIIQYNDKQLDDKQQIHLSVTGKSFL